jgi:hypothetical protein
MLNHGNKSMENRKPCKECPWTNNNSHSKSWPNYVNSMESIGQINNKRHSCHMITSDVWGYKSTINDSNICIGSLQTSETG